MPVQFILVVYDISNDKRRAKLHNLLLDYGTPVQYSVFECYLDDKNLAKLKKAAGRIAQKGKHRDNVRYYYLCSDCVNKIESSRPEEVTKSKPKETLVV